MVILRYLSRHVCTVQLILNDNVALELFIIERQHYQFSAPLSFTR